MLSKAVINLYNLALEAALWLSLIFFVIGGWTTGDKFGASLIGAAVGFLGWAVFAVVFIGAFLIIADIQKSVASIAASKQDS